MDLGLTGRTAFVAASTTGLGWAIAQSLAAEGAAVAVTGRRGELARERAASLPLAIGVELDLTDRASLDRAVDATHADLGLIDILVLNSGGPPPGAALGTGMDALEHAVGSLLYPHHHLLQRLVPHMRQQGWGRVVAVGSSGVQQPIPNLVLSNAVRGALAGLLKTLASEVAADGVTVNMVLPGRIATDRVIALDRARANREGITANDARAASEASTPAQRYGEPEEFGAVAAFLCGAPASYVTGSQIRVDGGLIAHL